MSEERILTKHPEGKTGVNISREKYYAIKTSILECLSEKELTYTDLANCVGETLKGKFEGSISWYVEVVKLDLEARNVIERISKTSLQLYRLKRVQNSFQR